MASIPRKVKTTTYNLGHRKTQLEVKFTKFTSQKLTEVKMEVKVMIATKITTLITTPFFYKQSIFEPRPENCLSFSKISPQTIV